MDVNPRIDIVIKSYNEEANIENCILSCLDIRDRYSGKTILIDGLSEDRTIEHAKKYSIEIYQVIDNRIERVDLPAILRNSYVSIQIISC